MNQHSHPEATAAVVVAGEACKTPARLPEPQDWECPMCSATLPHQIMYCKACGEVVQCDDEAVDDDPPMSPAVAELARIYAGRAIQREQVAHVIRRQTAIVNLCADIRARAGRVGK